MAAERPRVLLVVAPYYAEIAEALEAGARRALEPIADVDRIEVPGAFEIPGAIEAASWTRRYAAFVALGCVIRGETSHYDYVCAETARGVMELTIREGLAIGFGVLTVETWEQAEVRADLEQGDKGGEAARAALAMMELRRRLPRAVR